MTRRCNYNPFHSAFFCMIQLNVLTDIACNSSYAICVFGFMAEATRCSELREVVTMSIAYFKLYVSIGIESNELPEQVFHSAMRGIFGRILKGSFCIQKNIECSECSMQNCLYRQIFEPDPQGFENFKPYIIRHLASMPGRIDVEYVFFGNITKYAGSILHCILQMQDFPLLIKGHKYPIRILKILDSKKNPLYSEGEDRVSQPYIMSASFRPVTMDVLSIHFITPLRMKHDSKLMRNFSWEAFFRGLYYRVSYIDRVYNNSRIALPAIWQDTPMLEHDFSWQEMYRRSFRQRQSMSLGGLIGSLKIHNPTPDTAALLRLGSIMQVGKQCTFGLGKYKIFKES